MRAIGVLAALLGGVAAAAPAAAAERNYAVAGFDRVRAAGPFDVQVRVGPPVSVRAIGPQRAIDRLEVRSEGGQLIVRPLPGAGSDWRQLFARGERLVVQVTVPSLVAAALAGSGDLAIDRVRAPAFEAALAGSGNLSVGTMEVERLALSLAGSGDLTVAGRGRSAKASLAGSGDIQATGLTVADADVSVAGSGDLAITASGTARVSLVGSGDVTVAGRARCTVSKRGSGEVRCGG